MSQNLNYEFSEDDFKLDHDSNDKLMDKKLCRYFLCKRCMDKLQKK